MYGDGRQRSAHAYAGVDAEHESVKPDPFETQRQRTNSAKWILLKKNAKLQKIGV